jgi:tetratricopeptide (TPR) repeat protein
MRAAQRDRERRKTFTAARFKAAKRDGPPPASARRRWSLPGGDATLLAIVFIAALVPRLIYLSEVSRAVWFERPIGDSNVYLDRAKEILAGHWLGSGIPFHSSPIYPFFMALFLGLSGGSFFVLGIAQILIGSANCVLVALLAKRLAGGSRAAALLAGLSAAFYGLLAFFDADLLMIFLTLFFTDLSLLLLIRAKELTSPRVAPSPRGRLHVMLEKDWVMALLAGLSLGLAALDKTNLLLFAPVAAWYLAGEFSLAIRSWRWRPAVLFGLGTALAIVPVTVRNVVVGHDLVLVSSNAGVNLFIGNNAQGQGVFFLPAGSGLRNTDLYESSVEVAEHAAGRRLRPSEVSHFWSGRAWRFVLDEPVKAARLQLRKLALLSNHYEIPNHISYYFTRSEYARVLKWMFVGFWLITPLALLGIGLRWRRGLVGTDKLLLGFVLSYAVSLLPFFITERYRLPLVPVLIAFAATGVVEAGRLLRARALRPLALSAAGLAAAAICVNWPLEQFNHSFIRTVIAGKHLERALQNPATGSADIEKAIVDSKWSLEVDSLSAGAHYGLGSAYSAVGYYSGAIREWETTLRVDPSIGAARDLIADAQGKMARTGDRVSPDAIPLTPYEQAVLAEAGGREEQAMRLYEELVARDPFHSSACNNLAVLYYRQGRFRDAIKVLRLGLRSAPHQFVLLNNLAANYYRLGNHRQARKLWNECLRLQPGSAMVRDQLRMVRE